MARFLVLDWDHQQLNVVWASVRHGTVRLKKALALAEGQSPNPADAEALGRLLRERLKAAGIKPAPVLACVGRDRVILKEVRHPPVSAFEEPAIIRFQVIRELTDAPEEVVIDYVPAGAVEAGGERRALALILRRELLSTYQTLCRAAGLKLAGLCPRPFGTLACLKHLRDSGALTPAEGASDGAVGVLTVGKPWAEFCVVRGDDLLFARSLVASPTLPSEVRRNLAVYAGQSPQQPVRALYVAGGAEHAGVRDRLQELAGVPVHSFDPFAGLERSDLPVENRGAFTAAVGLLYAQAERRALPINFAWPKQPRAERNPNRRRLALVAATAGAVLVALVAYGYGQLESRSRQLDALYEEKADLDRQFAKLDEDSKRVKALDDWTRGDIVWLDELYDLTDRVPDVNGLRLTQLTGDPMTRTAKSPYVARMVLKGIMTNDNKSVNQLESELVNDGHHYRVKAKEVSRNRSADRFRFAQQFTMPVEIEKRPPNQYVRRLSDRPAAPGKPGDDASVDFDLGGFDGGQP